MRHRDRLGSQAGLALLATTIAAGSLAQVERRGQTDQAAQPTIELLVCQTCEGVGAGQGVEVRDGFVYLYGDADTGLIRQYRFDGGTPFRLVYTGVEVQLTKHGEDLIPHPTGLTFHPRYGTFIGNTVDNKGTIVHIDWDRMLTDRTLDRAVLNVTVDDAAVNGTRPEFVRRGDDWFVASADYRDWGNFVRLYDPARLAKARKTSEPGVLKATIPAGTQVQNVHWIDERELLVLVQNQSSGDDWRLTFVKPWSSNDYRGFKPYDAFEPTDELEGFHVVDYVYCVMFSSSRERNVWLGRIHYGGR